MDWKAELQNILKGIENENLTFHRRIKNMSPLGGFVNFTPAKLRKFKSVYNRQLKDFSKGWESTFFFEGTEYVMGYAKFIIEYLDDRQNKWGIA